LKLLTCVNGPDPTGFRFVHLLMSATLESTCFGTTKTAFRLTEMNWESLLLSLITTWWLPRCRTEVMLEPSRNMPTMSIVLSCRPAVRL
jgi:hypothetical protein